MLEALGQGAFADVYKARQEVLDRQVAVKIMKLDSLSESSLSRFKNEAKLCSTLNHPGMAKVLSYGETTNGAPYMVMEYCPGKTLAEHLHCGEPLGAHAISPIIMQLIDVLSYAHEHGVIHRDLKPENIMLQGDAISGYKVKLVDFGIARLMESNNSALTNKSSILGSPLYMSPEQCQGKSGDERSDIYALACIRYEMIFGSTPFANATSPMDVIYRKSQEDVRIDRSEKARAHLGKAMLDLLESSLSRAPSLRPQSMGEFRSAFIRAMGGMQHLSTQDLGKLSAPAEAKNNYGTWLILFCILVLLCALAFGTKVKKRHGIPAELEKQLKTGPAGLENAQTLLEHTSVFIARADIDGARQNLLKARQAIKPHTPTATKIKILMFLARLDKSEKFDLEADKVAEETNSDEAISQAYLSHARKVQDVKSKNMYLQKVIQRLEGKGIEKEQLALAYTTLGDLYRGVKDYAKAVGYYKRAARLWTEDGKDISFGVYAILAELACRFHDKPELLFSKIEAEKNRIEKSELDENVRKADAIVACSREAMSIVLPTRNPDKMKKLLEWDNEAMKLTENEPSGTESKANIAMIYLIHSAYSNDNAEFKKAVSLLSRLNSEQSLQKVNSLIAGGDLSTKQKEYLLKEALDVWEKTKPALGMEPALLILKMFDIGLADSDKKATQLYLQEAIDYCDRTMLDDSPYYEIAKRKLASLKK